MERRAIGGEGPQRAQSEVFYLNKGGDTKYQGVYINAF